MGFQSLPILVPTLIDPLNSTTTSLGSNATFTGTFSNLIAFPVVDVVIITDQPGTLFLDVSSDGVTVAQTTSFAVTTTLLFRSPFSWQYIRLRYTNGATAQTTFLLQCILRPVDPGLASLPLNRTVSTNSIAPLNRAVLNAQAPSGFFQNLQCDASNILLVDVSNFPAIQPVSGTVTANIGTTGGLALDSSLTTIDTDIKASQPRKLQDGSGNALTSQINGTQRALDVGIDVAGIQIDPRSQGSAAASTAGWPVIGGNIAESTAAWTSATALNTAITLTTTGYTSILVTLNQGTTITGGVVTFELSDTTGFTTAYPVNATTLDSLTVSSTYTLVASTNQAFRVNVRGAAAFRVRLSTVISGTGTINVGVQASSLPGDPIVSSEVFGKSGTSQLAITTTSATGHQSLDVNVVPDPNAVPVGSSISALVAANEVFTVATLLNQATSGTDNPLILIKNPAGSGKTLYVYSLSLGCTVANVTDIFRIFSDPTITTNGASFTPTNNNIGNVTASVMTAFTAPTISVSGTALNTYTYGQNSNSVEILNDFSIHVLPGHNLLLTGNPASNGRQASVTIVWAEV